LDMHEDMIMMKDGKVMIMRNGDMMPMKDEMTLSDGTKIMPNGQVVTADGTARMMMEGEAINRHGGTVDTANMPDREFKENMEDEELRDDIK
jgi:hypothetical protein